MNGTRRVFISYSWSDKPLARRVTRRLRQNGIDVFLDETHLGPGMALPESLRKEIQDSSHVLVLWTATASTSLWVEKEVEYAKTADPTPVIVPLLFAPPGRHSIVANVIGIDFSLPHHFERAFEQTWTVAGLADRAQSVRDRGVLAADLAATLREVPLIAEVFGSPIDRAVPGSELRDVQLGGALNPDDLSHRKARDETLAKARAAFQSWKRERISLAGLPAAGDPEFHALDFAMWCAAEITLLKTDELAPLAAPEVKTYPGIFAKVFGVTGAGFEAILRILARFPGFAADALRELIRADQIHDAHLSAVIELYEAVFEVVAGHGGRDQFMPFSCAELFLRNNLTRLTPAQKQIFLRLTAINGQGPYPGGPLDMLGYLYGDAELSAEVVGRILFWVENGLFDRIDATIRSEMPRLFYGFVNGRIKRNAAEADVNKLLDAAASRIRKLFRAATTESVLIAMQWIADADRLPTRNRACVERGFQEGVYSSEFAEWAHSAAIAPLAQALTAAIVNQRNDASQVKAHIRSELLAIGLPDRLN